MTLSSRLEWAEGRRNWFIFKELIEPRLSSALLEEHVRDPFGPHSVDLDIVLAFFRRNPGRTPVLVAVVSGDGQYQIGEVPRARGEPIKVDSSVEYSSEEEVDHAVLRRQIAAYTESPFGDDSGW